MNENVFDVIIVRCVLELLIICVRYAISTAAKAVCRFILFDDASFLIMLFPRPAFGFLFFFHADSWLKDIVFAILSVLSSKPSMFCR